MAYPTATAEDVESFEEHGYIVVVDAIDPADLDQLIERCDELIERKNELAYDWAWEKGEERDQREFKILQSSPTVLWPDFVKSAPFNRWAVEFGSALMRRPLEFWYDQFLAKPPGTGVATLWHQDEGYWGRNLDDKGVTCWMPFHDVGVENGCMHFVDGGHKLGVLEHCQPDHIRSDLVYCRVPEDSNVVACPIAKSSVTFHHSKTPHMTTANTTDQWRKILTQHLREVGAEGEGGHYPWKVYVNQRTGERTVPPTS